MKLCKNCKWNGLLSRNEKYCSPPAGDCTDVRAMEYKNELNPSGHCSRYRLKWWKFWVKSDRRDHARNVMKSIEDVISVFFKDMYM